MTDLTAPDRHLLFQGFAYILEFLIVEHHVVVFFPAAVPSAAETTHAYFRIGGRGVYGTRPGGIR